jgi:hypothetical protein
MYSGSQNDLLPKKSNYFIPLQNYFLEGHYMLHVVHSAEILDLCRLLYSWIMGFPQATI